MEIILFPQILIFNHGYKAYCSLRHKIEDWISWNDPYILIIRYTRGGQDVDAGRPQDLWKSSVKLTLTLENYNLSIKIIYYCKLNNIYNRPQIYFHLKSRPQYLKVWPTVHYIINKLKTTIKAVYKYHRICTWS